MVVVASLNGGSSSLKYALYRFDGDEPTVLAAASVDGRGDSVLDIAFDALAGGAGEAPLAIGHRVVHGGPHHDRPALVDDDLLDELRRLVPFAPLHLPGESEP